MLIMRRLRLLVLPFLICALSPAFAQYIDERARQYAERMDAKAPRQMDKATTFAGAYSREGFVVVLIDFDRGKFDASGSAVGSDHPPDKRGQHAWATKWHCSGEQLQFMRLGGGYEFHYSHPDGTPLHTIQITEADCED
jgi:hypothetical protein